MQLRTGDLLADQWPNGRFQPQHGIPVRGVAEVANVQKVRSFLKGSRWLGWWIDHQRAPMQQAAGHLELLDEQLDFDFGDHQVQVATINRCDFPFGYIGIGHELKLFA
ncbi:hypothetical protein D3C80_1437010 [compost metagenome]